MDDEEAKLQAQLRALQARVDLAKQQPQAHSQQPDYNYFQNPYQSSRGFPRDRYRTAPYGGGRGRGRGGHAFQNRTLVLNNGTTTSTPPQETSDTNMEEDLLTGLLDEPAVPAALPAREYVTKRGTSNQLVAKDVFNRETEARPQLRQQQALGQNEIVVEGILFRVTAGGSKLMRVTGELGIQTQAESRKILLNTADGTDEVQGQQKKETPKEVTLHNRVKYKRSTNGNLLRVDTTPDPRQPDTTRYGPGFAGQCHLGGTCKFAHDPKKVAICKNFFKKGECNKGTRCDLSHKPTYERVPLCTHFAKGHCKNADACHYAHVDVSPGPLVCRDFATYGYCDKGVKCDQQHVFECPDFAETGSCPKLAIGQCKLTHVTHAHVERRARRDDESEFESSDEEMEEAVDDDDDDESESDDEEEFVMTGVDTGISQNRDFVSLR